jgi:hypothetical protein
MAANGTELHLKFKDAADGSKLIKFPHADPNATDANIKTLADACVTNRLMWNDAPVEKVSAELVSVTVIPIDISD